MTFILKDISTLTSVSCKGSELGYCDKCKIKYLCYTGYVSIVDREEYVIGFSYRQILSLMACGSESWLYNFNIGKFLGNDILEKKIDRN